MKYLAIIYLIFFESMCYGQYFSTDKYYIENNKFKELKIKRVEQTLAEIPNSPYVKEYDSLGRLTAEYNLGLPGISYEYKNSKDTLIREIYTDKWHDVFDPIAIEKFVYNKQKNIDLYIRIELEGNDEDSLIQILFDKIEYNNNEIAAISHFRKFIPILENNQSSKTETSPFTLLQKDMFFYFKDNKTIVQSSFMENNELVYSDTVKLDMDGKIISKYTYFKSLSSGREELKNVLITEKTNYTKEYSTIENKMNYHVNTSKNSKSTNKRWKIYFDSNGLEIKSVILDNNKKETPIQKTNYFYY